MVASFASFAFGFVCVLFNFFDSLLVRPASDTIAAMFAKQPVPPAAGCVCKALAFINLTLSDVRCRCDLIAPADCGEQTIGLL